MEGQVTAEKGAQLAELIRESGCTVALTGAGISVPSGIPDFRTPGEGIWEKVDPMEVAHIDAFRRDPGRFWSGDSLPLAPGWSYGVEVEVGRAPR